ncbi:MAG: GyrI-like domain-containing protein [Proteobacteria bacterium]|nr:GyrI-like domain-containing protein [Pseudomonadota bacterium]
MEYRIEELEPKKLIGINLKMSLSKNRTAELWQTFMPRRDEVQNRTSSDYISMQKYGENWTFSPQTMFVKWASVEVSSFTDLPSNMETYQLQGGKYAVFVHIGPASAAANTMQYIFGEWFPESGYQLDNREHFELLPESYNPVDPNAREEIWIPIK